MIVVNKADVMLFEGGLITEASTIGIKPGEAWPDFISVVDDHNEGFLFQKSRPETHDGELVGYLYFTNGGAQLTVAND